MSNYPASIYAPRVLVDRVGAVYDSLKTKVFYAKDHNDPLAEIVAVETELGINPRGSSASVAARLATFIVAAGLLGGQILCGGSGVADILKLKGTSGNGTLTSPAVQVLVGNNGATVAMTVLNNGNVGIGTTGPQNLLHIRGSGTSGQVTAAMLLENASSGTLGLDITGAAGSSYARFRYGGGPGTGTNSMTGTAMVIGLEGSTAGNVGIGTTAPGAKLAVSDTITSGVKSLLDLFTPSYVASPNDWTEGVAIRMGYGSAGQDNYSSRIVSYNNANNYSSSKLQIQTHSASDGVWNTGLVMDHLGNVGIGITSPTAALHLKAGTATALTAPLKFTSGVNLTTAVGGNMEYNNTFHLTNSDNVRRNVVLSDGTYTAGLVVVGGKVKMNITGTDYNVLVQ